MNCYFCSSRPQKDEKNTMFYCAFDEELFIQQKYGSQTMGISIEIRHCITSVNLSGFIKHIPEIHIGENHIILFFLSFHDHRVACQFFGLDNTLPCV